MGKQSIFVLAIILSPLLIRMTSPTLYISDSESNPYSGPVLAILMDITCMWVILLIIMTSNRLIRWIRSRRTLSRTQLESSNKISG
ncbi:hypothetical protein [Spirosoma sp. KNUC1025]|uniref:hypothetical protein n=1 Tax=Spirosoma sp. KNUC1025 TaxID=2894082 RepID=UPI00386BFE59|nr:hypothetical protein LN737_09530 [Spirosoma sp. KNUC1025]